MSEPREKHADCRFHGPYIARMSAPPFDYWEACPQCRAIDHANHTRVGEAPPPTAEPFKWRGTTCDRYGIPRRFLYANLNSYVVEHGEPQRNARQWCVDYAASFDLALAAGRSAAFIGSVGGGKTHLAVGVLKCVVEAGCTGRYTTMADMMLRVRSTYGKTATETEADAIRAFVTPDLLVVDEVGKQSDTSHEHVQFFAVMNKRYNDMRPTIVVSNLSKPDFVAMLGDAIVDRLRENGGSVVTFNWPSHRKTEDQ